jgi:hypothetical protein
MTDIRRITRETVLALDNHIVGLETDTILQPLRDALKKAGVEPGCHRGRTDMITGGDECVEWYAGEIIDIFNNNALYAVNSVINLLDKFCPAEFKEDAR